MVKLYDTLKIKYASCPPDCSACEVVCAKERGGGKDGRIKSMHVPEIGFNSALTCVQCAVPQCIEVCPTAAITKDAETGVVRIEEDRCVGCSLCTLGCPYGGIYYDVEAKKAYSCDKCDGNPLCVDACKYEVLSHVDTRPIESLFRAEEMTTPGSGVCLGCPLELTFRHMLRVLGPDTFVFTAPGCGIHLNSAVPDVNGFQLMMTNIPSVMTGAKRYYRKLGKDVKCVAYVGDGSTVDVGFQPLSGAAERGENLIYICTDNEAYMNTGIQRSGSTPFKGWTYTTPVGKLTQGKTMASKNVPLIMAFHGIPYSATATVAYMDDFLRKVEKAMQVKDGMAYIHLFSPCPTGWRHPSDSTLEISRMAVETNYFPLWECERGEFRFTHEVSKPKPIGEFTRLMRRFSHLKGEALAELQQHVEERYNLIVRLTNM